MVNFFCNIQVKNSAFTWTWVQTWDITIQSLGTCMKFRFPPPNCVFKTYLVHIWCMLRSTSWSCCAVLSHLLITAGFLTSLKCRFAQSRASNLRRRHSIIITITTTTLRRQRQQQQQQQQQGIRYCLACFVCMCYGFSLYLGRPAFLVPVGVYSYTNLGMGISFFLSECCVQVHI